MSELSKIHRVIAKRLPEAPHEVLLVLDGTSGQNAISQARGFTDAVQCTGIVLSKIDGTAKGGVVIPIRQQFQMPVNSSALASKPTIWSRLSPRRLSRRCSRGCKRNQTRIFALDYFCLSTALKLR